MCAEHSHILFPWFPLFQKTVQTYFLILVRKTPHCVFIVYKTAGKVTGWELGEYSWDKVYKEIDKFLKY